MTSQQILLILGWLVAMIAIVAGALVIARRRGRRIENSWREFARRNGHTWVDESGPWYRRRPISVIGAAGTVPFILDLFFVHTGKSKIAYTRVRGTLPRAIPDKVSVCTNDFVNRLNALFTVGRPRVETGDSSFDARMIVRSKSREAALSILDAELRGMMLAFPRSLRFEFDGTEAKLSWRSAETDIAKLERGCELLTFACRQR